MPPPADLLHRLTVGHPSGAVPIDLHQLIADLQVTQSQSWGGLNDLKPQAHYESRSGLGFLTLFPALYTTD